MLKLLLQGVAIANIADNAASSPITSVYLALHTADPHSGNQTTSEAAYPSYARVAVERSTDGWSISGNIATLGADALFPAATGSPSETETWASVGSLSNGAGLIFASGQLASSIPVTTAGATPKITDTTTFTVS
ncbi:MAG TPA: hypothetical protein VGN12_08515 [Pirellulales bacterium]